MLKEYFWLGVNNLRKRRLRSWLTMIGIFIGIAAVVSLISLGQGMQQAIENQFSRLGADKITIETKGVVTGPPGSNSVVILTKSDLDVVRRAQGVASASGRLIEPVTVDFNRKTIYTYVASVPDSDLQSRDLVLETANLDIIAGRQLKVGDQYAVVVGEDYLTSPKFNNKALSVGDRIEIDGQKAQVIGVFKKTGNPIWDMSFLMNERPVRNLINNTDKYDVITAKIAPGTSIQDVAENIKKDLRKHRDVKEGKEDFTVSTPEEAAKTFQTVLNIVEAVLVGIAAISLLVGGVGIMNTMYTSVLERRREIGIMKAIGAKNSDVMIIFLIESGMLGLIGGAIGIALGMGFSKLVEVIATAALGTALIQAYFPLYLILGSLAFSFGVGTAAGVFPAMQASRLPPVEALRQ
jgi:putative ABC transport system permease protein